MGRIETETGKIQDQRYDEVGTPSEIGARAKGTNMLAAAAYLSSLPKNVHLIQVFKQHQDLLI